MKKGLERSMTFKVHCRAYIPLLTMIIALPLFFLALVFPNPVLAINVLRGDTAPDFTAATIEGETITLSDLRGEIVFVAFWSSWCSRCKEEMDYLKELKSEYPSVKFLAINAESEKPDDEAISRMKKAVEDWEVPFVVLIDRGLKIWDLYKVNALPTSFIVGADGTILFAEPNFYYASPKNINEAMQRIFDPLARYSEN